MTVVINGTTGISGVAGSASTPALVGSDADSGYYINSANEPNASVNGTATWSAASSFGFKNRIINGSMMIDQRNAGASVSVSTDSLNYSIDRWKVGANGGGVFSAQQSTTAPTGFKNSLLLTVTTVDSSIAATDYYNVQQRIEGFNVADFNLGSASAVTFTISFWVRSSLTGTFGGSLYNSSANRAYPFTYTISSANTFEYKTVTVAGDTTGTWTTDNSAGLTVNFSLGAGSTYLASAGSWTGALEFGATGQTNLIATNGATFYIAGVQLEKGSTATSFDFRSYGTELALCQRYYQTIAYFIGYLTSTTGTRNAVPLSCALRATPTVAVTATANSISNPNGANGTPSTISNTTYQTNGTTVWFDMASSTTMTSATVGSGCLTTAVGSLSAEL